MEIKKGLLSPQAISINERLNSIIDEMINETVEQQRKINSSRFCLQINYDTFERYLVESATNTLRKRGEIVDFIIDENNSSVIKQLYYYLVFSDKFNGDLHKGIMLQGKYGSGKTLLLESFILMRNYLIRKLSLPIPTVTFITSMELSAAIKESGVKQLSKRPLAIDEFGREPKVVLDFGNTIRPIAELISARSEFGTITFATSNFSLDTLSSDDFYGAMIGDRLRAMFNFIVVSGNSRRV